MPEETAPSVLSMETVPAWLGSTAVGSQKREPEKTTKLGFQRARDDGASQRPWVETRTVTCDKLQYLRLH